MNLIIFFIFLKVLVVFVQCFEYSEQDLWYLQYPTCGKRFQSPIAIDYSDVTIARKMRKLEYSSYTNLKHLKINLLNDGHSAKLYINDSRPTIKPIFFGGNLKNCYIFEQLHFHWGNINSRGSEHIIYNKTYPLEMHIVHRNSKYFDVNEAMNYKDGLAVVAVLFELRKKELKALNTIAEKLHLIRNFNSEVTISTGIQLISLLPSNTDTFFTYSGSLTTPPCSEAVTWFIFAKPSFLSLRQLKQFRILKDSNGKEILENNRKVQPLNKRRILLRKVRH